MFLSSFPNAEVVWNQFALLFLFQRLRLLLRLRLRLRLLLWSMLCLEGVTVALLPLPLWWWLYLALAIARINLIIRIHSFDLTWLCFDNYYWWDPNGTRGTKIQMEHGTIQDCRLTAVHSTRLDLWGDFSIVPFLWLDDPPPVYHIIIIINWQHECLVSQVVKLYVYVKHDYWWSIMLLILLGSFWESQKLPKNTALQP